MADMYRITRTIVRGQFANDVCFVAWLAGPAASATVLIKGIADPLNNGGSNDANYYLWKQTAPVKTPDTKVCDVSLVTRDGFNGWATLPEAQAVLDAEMIQSGATKAMVDKANAAAVSPANIAKGAAEDLTKDAGKLAGDVGKGVLAGGAVTWFAEALIFGGLAWLGVKYVQSKAR